MDDERRADANEAPRDVEVDVEADVQADVEADEAVVEVDFEVDGVPGGPHGRPLQTQADDPEPDDATRPDDAPEAALGTDEAAAATDPDEPVDRAALVRGMAAAEAGDDGSGPVTDDEFAATRQKVADPDDWRLEARREVEIEVGDETPRLTPEDEARAKRLRPAVLALGVLGGALTLAALILRFAELGPRGADTWFVTLACAAVLGAAWLFPLAHFPNRRPDGGPGAYARARMVRELVLRAFGVAFGILLCLVGILELLALFVALEWIADLSQASITLAKYFVIIPTIVLTVLIAALFVRVRVPSKLGPVPRERVLLLTMLGLFGAASFVASFFALGLPAVVKATAVEARHGIFIQGVALGAVLAYVNLRLRYPHALRIAREEIDRAKQVDRRSAESMNKRMTRNYLLALVFVVGSIGFLISQATGMLKPTGGSMDLVLLVYVGLGLLFMGIIGVHYYQAKQIRQRVILVKPGQTMGKRRFRPDEITRYTILGVSGFFALVFLLLAVLVGTGSVSSIGPLPVGPSWATDFAVLAVLSGMGPYGLYYAREMTRIRTIDAKFPDFLRDLAESQRAGMTLPRALVTSSKGVYGPLTDEIKIMAAQVEWGVSFNEALRRFAERTRTPLIERTVSLICEASASGGNVVDVLTAASDDAREIKNILQERKQQMGVYSLIVYIAFGVFLTVIAVLNSQFIPELANASKGAAGTQLGGIQFGDIPVARYQTIFFHAALIQGIGGGLVSGVMTEGHPMAGLRHGAIMTMVAYLVFRIVIL